MRRDNQTAVMAVVGGTAAVNARLKKVARSVGAMVVPFPTIEDAVENRPDWVLYVPNGSLRVTYRTNHGAYIPIIALVSRIEGELPDADEVFLLEDLGVAAASRLRTLRQTAALLEELLSATGSVKEVVPTMRKLGAVAESVEDRTGGHPLRVASLCLSIALALGFDEAQAASISAASLLHDLGKARVPSCLLRKPSKLTPDEYAVVQRHTQYGAEWLTASENEIVRMSAAVACSHHERWDGGGYPEGLSGDQIPLESRIVAVADVFDALVSDRPYKPAWNRNQALYEIEAGAGKQFDPEVAQAFLSLPDARLA